MESVYFLWIRCFGVVHIRVLSTFFISSVPGRHIPVGDAIIGILHKGCRINIQLEIVHIKTGGRVVDVEIIGKRRTNQSDAVRIGSSSGGVCSMFLLEIFTCTCFGIQYFGFGKLSDFRSACCSVCPVECITFVGRSASSILPGVISNRLNTGATSTMAFTLVYIGVDSSGTITTSVETPS